MGQDSNDGSEAAVMIQEACNETGLTKADFQAGRYGYSLDPAFLRFSLKRSLKRLQLESVDCLIIQNPYEVYRQTFGQQKYEAMLARAFEFYEHMRQVGRVASYGVQGNISFHGSPKQQANAGKYELQQLTDLVRIAE